MVVIGINSGHDGAVGVVRDGVLRLYCEAQKNNNVRYCHLNSARLQEALQLADCVPDVISTAGWFQKPGGYYGVGEASIVARDEKIENRTVHRFATSHERAHAFCSYGMSPFDQGHPCYLLIWEGSIGTFYVIDDECSIRSLCSPLRHPGHRYALAFELADQSYLDDSDGGSFGTAGKLMALAGVLPEHVSSDCEESLALFLAPNRDWQMRKRDLARTRLYNIGHTNRDYRQFARRLGDEIFNIYYEAAKANVKGRLPLIIGGGCGLNCGWNTRWMESNLFSDVFIPPCTDDSGIALGAAIDAQRHYTGSAKVEWDVFAGEPFQMDIELQEHGFFSRSLDYVLIANLLADNAVVAWVEGRYEIGPRALGHRSLLATPLAESSRHRLNKIKGREHYRPIAPICRLEDVDSLFDWTGSSPHMLYFQRVKSNAIPAVTHDDGTARVQTIAGKDVPRLHELLTCCKATSGVGVLCNTSLNNRGRGFINKASDLKDFVDRNAIEACVVDGQIFLPQR